MNAFKLYGFIRNGGWVAAVEQRFPGWGDQAPILMLLDLEQRFEVEERMYALGVQPDRIDYKPYHAQNLINKLNGLARRGASATPTPESAILRVRSLVIDTEQETVLLNGALLKLSQLEFRLLHYLTSHMDVPLTREQLLEGIWGITGLAAVNNRNVDVYIGKLRKKLAGSDCADLIERGRNGAYLLKSSLLPAGVTLPEGVTDVISLAQARLITGRLVRQSHETHLPKTIELAGARPHSSLDVGIKVGRSAQQCDIVLPDQRISRWHATFFAAQGHIYLRDENSKGHTYLEHRNGDGVKRRQLEPHVAVQLANGDLVYFNTVVYRLELAWL
jgi:DNA-binding response OmpR family regulator